VSNLSSRSTCAPIQLTVDDVPGADAGPDLDVGEILTIPASAPPLLGERAQVRVILDENGQA
jgi:hypothetical protein